MEIYKAKLYANDEVKDIIVKEENNVFSELCTSVNVNIVSVYNMKTGMPYIKDLEEDVSLKEIQKYIRHFKYEEFLDLVTCNRKERKKIKSKMKTRRLIMNEKV